MRLIMAYDDWHDKYSRTFNHKRIFFLPAIRSKDCWEVTYSVLHNQCPPEESFKCTAIYSCQITIKLQKKARFENMVISAKIKRTDDSEDRPNGVLIIRFQTMNGKKCPVRYRLRFNFEDGDTESGEYNVDEFFREWFEKSDGVFFAGDMLIVRVRLHVNCPQVKKSDTIIDATQSDKNVNDKKSDVIVDKQSDSIVNNKKADAIVADKKADVIVADKKSVAIVADKKTDAIVADKKSYATVAGKKI